MDNKMVDNAFVQYFTKLNLKKKKKKIETVNCKPYKRGRKEG